MINEAKCGPVVCHVPGRFICIYIPLAVRSRILKRIFELNESCDSISKDNLSIHAYCSFISYVMQNLIFPCVQKTFYQLLRWQVFVHPKRQTLHLKTFVQKFYAKKLHDKLNTFSTSVTYNRLSSLLSKPTYCIFQRLRSWKAKGSLNMMLTDSIARLLRVMCF